MENNYITRPIGAKVAFKGHTLTTNAKGEKEYQFYLPTSNNVSVKPEVLMVGKDGKTITDLTSSLTVKEGEIPVWTLPEASINDKDASIAYRFNVNGKNILDNTVRMNANNAEYNEAILQTRPALERARQIYHTMPDSLNPSNDKLMIDEYGHEIQRNHFNKFDGTLQSVTDKIKEIKAFGAKRILGTPIFGDDTASSHGYWTANAYQITSTLGNVNDFKKMQIALFKNGLGWIADGAFANEGIEGIHIQDIIRWGEKSPFLNMFDIKDFSMNGLKFGVLPPVGSEAEKHFDIKLVNSPLIYTFDKDGKPSKDFGKVNPNYDKTKPTYLQQFDKRLMDEDYINSSDMLSSYTKKQLKDVDGIRNYKDGVQLLHYNVDPTDVSSKIKEMKKLKLDGATSEHSAFRNMLTKWRYFSLEQVDKEGTIRNWTGKKDIFAINYQNSKAQKYILGVPTYWTNENDQTLTTYIAKQLSEAKGDKAEQTKIIENMSKEFDLNLTEEEMKNILGGTYKVELAPAKDTVKEALKSFQMLASEAPREIASLFADESVSESKILDEAFEKDIAPVVEDIFKSVNPKAFVDGKLTEEGKNLFRLSSDDIMRYVSAYILGGERPTVNSGDGYNEIKLPSNFGQRVFKNVDYQSASRDEAVEKLLTTFKNGSKSIKDNAEVKNDIKTIIKNTSSGIDFSLLKMSKSIISKLEAGLEWRIDASKDIMDLDQINQGRINPQKTWKVVEDFWGKFVKNVREFNPKAYVIGEVTCLSDYFKNDADKMEKDFIKNTGFTTQTNYSHIFNIMNRIVHGAPEEAFGGPYHVGLVSKNPNDYTLTSALKNFFNSGYADNIRFSHEAVGNHDKPRALHGYALNIEDFFNIQPTDVNKVINTNEFKAVVKDIRAGKDYVKGKSDVEILDIIKNGSWLFTDNDIRKTLLEKDSNKKAFEDFTKNLEAVRNKIADKDGVNATRNALFDSVDKSAGQLKLTNEQVQKLKNAINDMTTDKVSENVKNHFKINPFNFTIEKAVQNADLGLNKEMTEKLIGTVHNEMLKPAFSKYKSMLQILVALPGNPTIYAGDEFGETGFETPGNNVYVHNRNQIHRNWAKDSNRPDFAKFYSENQKIFNLRNRQEFSPFVNGDTIVSNEFAGNNIAAVYRYNKDSDVIAVFNTNGLSNTRNDAFVVNSHAYGIPINADFDLTKAYGTENFVRVNSEGQRVDDGIYKLVKNTLKKFTKNGCEAGDIELKDAATYFVRDLEYNGQKISLSNAIKAQNATTIAVPKLVKGIKNFVKNEVNVAENAVKKTNKGKLIAGIAGLAGLGVVGKLLYEHSNSAKAGKTFKKYV